MFDLLERCDADVIALQEVTPAFLVLLQQALRFDNYAWSMTDVDSWHQLRPTDEGWTVDSAVNLMAARELEGAAKQKRIDRVYYERTRLTPRSIEVIGRAAYLTEPSAWVSDHFGLLATLQLS